VIVASADPGSGAPGVVVSYDDGTNGRDYWLAPGEPHCADCHTPPFVESEGGWAFPIDQKGKYSLMRYSAGHAGIHCQGCHGSSHGLAPVGSDVDSGTRAAAVSLNPDGSAGPLRCAACHVTNDAGVPVSLETASYRGRPLARDYELAVEYSHTLR
jgi:mono/diheme cytochrome c family protein